MERIEGIPQNMVVNIYYEFNKKKKSPHKVPLPSVTVAIADLHYVEDTTIYFMEMQYFFNGMWVI